jgi:hypothetical protein
MSQPLTFWAKLLFRLAFVLLAIGLLPLLATELLALDPVLPVLLSLTVAPLGGLALLVAVILFLAALGRRWRGPS